MSGIARDDHAPPGSEPSPSLEPERMLDEPNTSLAWRMLTSARTFLVLTALLGAFLALAAFLPQRPLPEELARALPFASAEVARDLGLTDALTAWPTLLLLMLLALNAVGLVLGARERREHPPTTSLSSSPNRGECLLPDELGALRERLKPISRRFELLPNGTVIIRRGLFREGLGLALLGLLTLLAALVVNRTQSTEARLSLGPGTPTPSEAKLREGDLMLLASLPYGLICDKPDPQDPLRRFPCRMADRDTPPTDLVLQPGERTHLGDFSLTPVRERLRSPTPESPVDLVLSRSGGLERLRVEPGKRLALSSGEHLTAFHGPDGPILIAEPTEGPPTLLVPRTTLAPSKTPLAFAIEAEHPTLLEVDVTTSPERSLFFTGLGLLLLGLLLIAFVPHLRLELHPTSGGTLIIASSLNRPNLPSDTLAALTSSRNLSISLFKQFTPNLLSIIGLALALTGLILGLDHLAGPALPLALATVLALPTRATPILGALTLIAGLGSTPQHLASPTDLILPLGSGLALGLLARHIASDTHFRGRHDLAGGLAALFLTFVLALPLPHLALASPEGGHLSLPAILGDGGTMIRTPWPVSPFIEAPGSTLTAIAATASLLIAIVLFATHIAPSKRLSPSLAARLGVIAGALGVAAGVTGLISLLSPPALSAEALRETFNLAASRDGAVLALELPAYTLELSSRPFIDGLRILAGLVLLAIFIVRREPTPTLAAPSLGLPLYLGLAAGCLGLLGATTLAAGLSGPSLLLLAGLILVLGAMVATARLRHEAPFAPRLALLAGTLMIALDPLLPMLYGA
jgi:hypothetical protein